MMNYGPICKTDDEVSTSTVEKEEEDIYVRHQREEKELMEKIQKLKSAVKHEFKHDRDKREATCAQMLKDMKACHAKEIEELDAQSTAAVVSCDGEFVDKNETPLFRRSKLTETEKRAKKEEEALAQMSEKDRERHIIDKNLEEIDRKIVEVPPGADSMYSAISHQLSLREIEQVCEWQVRGKCVYYLTRNEEEMRPLIPEVTTDAKRNYEYYIYKVESTADRGGAPGGELELVMLTKMLKRAIRVYSADGEKLLGEEFMNTQETSYPLEVACFKHAGGEGDYYTSISMI